MLLIKHPIQGGAAGTHTFSKLSFSQILRTRPSLNRNCTHSEIYRPVPSLAGMPVPVPAPDGARTPVPSLAGTPVPVPAPDGARTPVPSLVGTPVPVPAPDGARTPVPSLAGTPVPVLLPFGTLEFPPPPPPLANKTADMTSNNVNNKAEYLKYLFIVFFNKNKIKASTCNLKSAE